MAKKKSEEKSEVIVVASTPEDEAKIVELMDVIGGVEDDKEPEGEPVTAENFDDKIREELQKAQGKPEVKGFDAGGVIKGRLSGLPCYIGDVTSAAEDPAWAWLEAKALDLTLDHFETLEGRVFANTPERMSAAMDEVLRAANFEQRFAGLVVFLHAAGSYNAIASDRPGYSGRTVTLFYGAKAPRR